MEDIRDTLLKPTQELIQRLEPVKDLLSFQERFTLAELKVYVARYELEKLEKLKIQLEKRKHDL